MQRALAAFLILSLLGGQAGILGALLGRHQAQERMQRKIAAVSDAPRSTEAIQHLTLSRSERKSADASFRRVEEGEFWYKDHLYDVVHDEWRGSTWHVWALPDREEEKYMEALAESLRPIVTGSTAPVHQRPLAHRLPALVPGALASPPPPLRRARPFPHFSAGSYQGPYLEVSDPPPWGQAGFSS